MFTEGQLYGSGAIMKASFIGSGNLPHNVFLQVNAVSSVHDIGPNFKVMTIRIEKVLAIPRKHTPQHFSVIMVSTSSAYL